MTPLFSRVSPRTKLLGRPGMASNGEISRLFAPYAELLLSHKANEYFSGLLSGAACRIRRMTEEVSSLNKNELSQLSKPEIYRLIADLNNEGTIKALDE